MSKCKKIVLSCCLMALLLCSLLPSVAFATEGVVYQMPCAEPTVSDTQGYIVFEMSSTKVSNYSTVQVFTFRITPHAGNEPNDGEENVTPVDDVSLFLTEVVGNSVSFVASSDMYRDFYFSSASIYSDGKVVYSPVSASDSAGSFIGSFKGAPDTAITAMTVKGPVVIDSSVIDQMPSCQVTWTEDNQIYNQMFDIVERLYLLHEDNVEMIEKLNTIVARNNTIISLLESFYIEQIEVSWLIEGDLLYLLDNTDEIESLLQQILDYLQPDTDVNISKVDSSNVDEYHKAEQSLIDNSGVDINNAIKVEIDQNALVIIWDMVDDVLNTHPQVFGLVFTILSISIVALILGRGN